LVDISAQPAATEVLNQLWRYFLQARPADQIGNLIFGFLASLEFLALCALLVGGRFR
jgi:hypothetical protein